VLQDMQQEGAAPDVTRLSMLRTASGAVQPGAKQPALLERQRAIDALGTAAHIR